MNSNASLIRELRAFLKSNADEKIRESTKRFFKENVKAYGMKSAVVQKISMDAFRKLKGASKAEIFSLCDELLASGYMEEAFIAYNWADLLHKDFMPADLKVFERWVNTRISNWAECDTLCNHTIGAFMEMHPQYIATLKKWAHSKNRWTKRAAAVSLILPARKGMFLADVFEISDTLLTDPDDLVQKGYGWLLKETSRKHQKEVFNYVCKHKSVMPRTALRYAIEKMPEDLRRKAMIK